MDIIPNIFHFIYDLEFMNMDIEINIYFSIKSIIKINNPELIYFYYIYLPSGILWNNIKNNLTLKKIELPEEYKNNIKLFFQKYKNMIIYKNLFEYGGIYIDKYTLLINPINDLFSHYHIKSKNNEIICSVKKYNDLNENIFILENLNYDSSYDNIYNVIFNEITDYSFGNYFHMIKNCYLINIESNKDNLKNIDMYNMYNIFNKITIYNLLIRYILTYNNINNEIYYNNLNNKNVSLINNIDKIYWINLEKSLYRKSKMIQILNNFNIENIRISAYDGGLEENINEKYFYSESNTFPNYSNKEYAILLSHLTTIEKYCFSINNKYGVALICEDDLSLDFINYWKEDIKTIVDNAPCDWEIIMLGYFSLNLNRLNKYEKWNNEWSAISYLVNHRKINKINDLKKSGKWICNEHDLMVSDNYLFSKFNTYVYKYPYFTFPNNNTSTFHEDHLDYHRIYKISNYITLENIYNLYC